MVLSMMGIGLGVVLEGMGWVCIGTGYILTFALVGTFKGTLPHIGIPISYLCFC